MISTTTLLPSLADLSGAFDVPSVKCPPDRGSQGWVTASLASKFPSPPSNYSPHSSYEPEYFPRSIAYPPTPPPENANLDPIDQQFHAPLPKVVTAPQPIKNQGPTPTGLETPPMTPEELRSGDGSISAISANQINDFLYALFPRSGISALLHAKVVSVSDPNLGTAFDGVILELPGKPKTLYVDGKNAEQINLRESIVALLDLADEQLECTALVIALERSSPGLGDLLHSLMYVGGTVVTKPPFQVDPAYVLVGLEI